MLSSQLIFGKEIWQSKKTNTIIDLDLEIGVSFSGYTKDTVYGFAVDHGELGITVRKKKKYKAKLSLSAEYLLDSVYIEREKKFLEFKMGRFKIPVGHERLENYESEYTYEMSQVGDEISPGRDIGATVTVDIGEESKLTLGAFNGTDTTLALRKQSLLLPIRMKFSLMDKKFIFGYNGYYYGEYFGSVDQENEIVQGLFTEIKATKYLSFVVEFLEEFSYVNIENRYSFKQGFLYVSKLELEKTVFVASMDMYREDDVRLEDPFDFSYALEIKRNLDRDVFYQPIFSIRYVDRYIDTLDDLRIILAVKTIH